MTALQQAQEELGVAREAADEFYERATRAEDALRRIECELPLASFEGYVERVRAMAREALGRLAEVQP